MIYTGNPTRFELWSCAIVVITVFVALAGRANSNNSLMQQQIEISKLQLDCLIAMEAKLNKMASTATTNSVNIGRDPALNDLTREILKKQGHIE